jgi:recombination protein RecA
MPKRIVKEEESNGFDFNIPGVVQTRLTLLNWATGINGIPMGRQVTIDGEEGVGKTSLAWEIISAYLTSNPGEVEYLEGEGKPPAKEHLHKSFGITDFSRIKANRPPDLEHLLDYLESRIKEVDTGVFVIDSLASFGANRDGKKLSEDARLGKEATKNTLIMSGPFYKILSEKRIVFLVINQLRDTIGTYVPMAPHAPGGRAMRHIASIDFRVSIHPKGLLKDSADNVYGQLVDVWVKKNMVGPPHREVQIPFYYHYGFDNEESILIEAVKNGYIKAEKGWYDYNGSRHRKVDVTNMMREHKEVFEDILKGAKLT